MILLGPRSFEATADLTWLKRFLLVLAVVLGIGAGLALGLGLLSRTQFLVSTALVAALLGLVLAIVLLRVGKGHETHVFVIASVGHFVFMLALLPLVPQLAATILPTAIIPVFVATPYLRTRGLAKYSVAVVAFCLGFGLLALVFAHQNHIDQMSQLVGPLGGTDVRTQVGDQVRRLDVALGAQLLGVMIVVAIILSLLMRYAIANGQARHLALHDGLTGLANRSLFMDRVAHAMDRGRRGGASTAVLFLDVDAFKSINDQHGHGFGDEILRRVARLIDESTRATDTAARIGGDEFAILIEDVDDPADVHAVAERLQALLSRPLEMPDGDIQVRVSMGVAFQDDGVGPDALVRSADDAMYESKRQGRGELVVYRPDMSAASAERRYVKRAFRGVVERGELRLQFQPIVRLGTSDAGDGGESAGWGSIVGVEALLRWQDPEHGWRMPAQFVSLAEETGDIVPIGHWVLQEAARQVVAWRSLAGMGQLRLAVNVSVRQLQLRAFEDEVVDVLGAVGLPAGATILEIGEAALALGGPTASDALARLRAHGLKLALDDLGRSHSSFGMLKDNAVDYIKLDRTLVLDAIDRPTNGALLRTAVELGKAVDASVVAEGIETSEQLDLLTRLGCELGQGYLFSPPLDPDGMQQLLTAPDVPWKARMRRQAEMRSGWRPGAASPSAA